MNTKQILNPAFPSVLTQIQDVLGGQITEVFGVFTLNIASDYATGSVKYSTKKDGFSTVDFNLTTNTDFVYKLKETNNEMFYFLYCIEGVAFYKSKTSNKYQRIEELRSAIISCDDESNQINIKKDIPLVMNLIAIEKNSYFEQYYTKNLNTSGHLSKLLDAFMSIKSYMYLCSYNLKVAEQLRILNSYESYDNFANILRLESRYNLILALHIEQFYNEIHFEKNSASLSKTELQKIRQLTEIIIDKPEIQHSISSLCGIISISPAKLQEGFKDMHGTTVADFVRNVRIEKAERLLTDTDLNISEIVYTIGLTSRSYFCKIFKSRYHCSPKQYRKKIRENLIKVQTELN